MDLIALLQHYLTVYHAAPLTVLVLTANHNWIGIVSL